MSAASRTSSREPSGSSRFVGTGKCAFRLCDSAYDAISRGLNQSSLPPEILDKLDKHFPSILHLSSPPLDSSVRPIGVGKRSCFCCVLWIESHNGIFGTQWIISGSHGKPYANWALSGAAYSYGIGADGKSSVDEVVWKAVLTRLTDALDWLFPGQRRISDEHVSSGDESSSSEQGAPGRVATLVRPPRG